MPNESKETSINEQVRFYDSLMKQAAGNEDREAAVRASFGDELSNILKAKDRQAGVSEEEQGKELFSKNMGGSMLMPPEREGYESGSEAKYEAEIFDKFINLTKEQREKLNDDNQKATENSALYKLLTKKKSPEEEARRKKIQENQQRAMERSSIYKKLNPERDETEEEKQKAIGDMIKKEYKRSQEIDKNSKAKGGSMKLKYAEGGSMLVPPEMEMEAEQDMPVDTYDNIPEDEKEEAEASQLPDEEMEDNYLEYVLDESLDQEDQEYLMSVLESDERLSGIFDKVMDVAGEFSGEGEVDGPGTGVSDSIPARLSDGEFVVTEKATDQIGADNLQTMMDDAEQAYDGGYMKKAFGGMVDDVPTDDRKEDEEINSMMIASNQMPSVRPR